MFLHIFTMEITQRYSPDIFKAHMVPVSSSPTSYVNVGGPGEGVLSW